LLKGEEGAHRFWVLLPAVYLLILGVFFLYYHIVPGPEFYAVFLLIYAAGMKRTRRFVRDWFPFVALFITYEAVYGFADDITGIVHVKELAEAEFKLFGNIPSLFLQQFYRSAALDYTGAFLYSLHFILPVAFGFILWRYSPKNYSGFVASLLICSYAALTTFLIFPSAPPWYGVNATRILLQVYSSLGVTASKTIFDYIEANPFAAFPSLHAAYPWLISLYAIKIKGRRLLLILLLPVGISFRVVYLGEHYIVDVIGGVAYATCAFLLVEKAAPRLVNHLGGRKDPEKPVSPVV
jgi:membrane-associated phospholipid phosphatase